jgi:hypothetical protein
MLMQVQHGDIVDALRASAPSTEPSLIIGAEQAGRGYPTVVNLDLRRPESLPGGNTLIEDLRRLNIRLALCCKRSLRAVVSLFSL